MGCVPFALHPVAPQDPALEQVAAALDPVLSALGFAPGRAGAADGHGQVIFCRGFVDGTDGSCIDLVIDLEAVPDRRITGVRYWGFPSDRWHLPFDPDTNLTAQLTELARTLAIELA